MTHIDVAAIMHYKEVEIMFEVMDVDVQINGSDCGLHAVATVAQWPRRTVSEHG